MIYDTPAKADDGMRHVKVFTEDKKNCFVQLIGVDVLDIDKNFKRLHFSNVIIFQILSREFELKRKYESGFVLIRSEKQQIW